MPSGTALSAVRGALVHELVEGFGDRCGRASPGADRWREGSGLAWPGTGRPAPIRDLLARDIAHKLTVIAATIVFPCAVTSVGSGCQM